MSNTDKLHEFAVKVNGVKNGSGCLFQPDTADYTYVLTAKHVIEGANNINITREINGENQALAIIGKPYFLEDPATDIAIIKVQYVEGLSQISRKDEIDTRVIDYYLTGHPAERRQFKKPSFRADQIQSIFKQDDKYSEAAINPVPLTENIEGMSGGGIIGIENKEYFLTGIQKGMTELAGYLGRIDFIRISAFDEIISKFPDELKPIESVDFTTSNFEIIPEESPALKFDENEFNNYLEAVQNFSKNIPYKALYNLLTDSSDDLSKLYIPLPLKVSNIKGTSEDFVDPTNTDSGIEEQNEQYPDLVKEEADDLNEVDLTENTEYSLPGILEHVQIEENKQNILLLGVAGSGKSTILYQIAKDAWNNPQALGLDKPYLPLIIRLRALASVEKADINERLIESISLSGDIVTKDKLPDNFFSTWSKQKTAPWLIMLDGLDEVPAAKRDNVLEWLNNFLRTIKNESHLVILTSRPLSENQYKNLTKDLLICNLLPFDKGQQKEFAIRWFAGQADDFLAKINKFSQSKTHHWDRIVLTPLLYTIAAVVYQRKGDLPTSGQNELYQSFIDILFREIENKKLSREVKEVFDIAKGALEQLALATTDYPEKNTFQELTKVCIAFVGKERAWGTASTIAAGEKLCGFLSERSGIFYRQGEICSWVHPTMREFLAARVLNQQIDFEGKDLQTVLGDRIFSSKNYELIMAFSRTCSDREALLRWLCKQARQKMLANAADIAYDVWEESDQPIQDKLQTDVIIALASGLGDSDNGLSIRNAIERQLIEFGKPAVEPLIQYLTELNSLQSELFPEWDDPNKHPDPSTDDGGRLYSAYLIREKIIKILGEIGDERAIEPLIGLLPSRDPSDGYRIHISNSAEKALACIGGAAISRLIEKIKNNEIDVSIQRAYLECLRTIGIRTTEISDLVSEILSEDLDSENELIRKAVWVAVSLRDKTQAEVIKTKLNSDDLLTVDAAATYFFLMPDSSAIPFLIDAFEKCRIPDKDNNNYERSRALSSLCSAILVSDSKEAVQTVLKYLKKALKKPGILYPYEIIDILLETNFPDTLKFLMQELIRLIASGNSDNIISHLIRSISKIWDPKQISILAAVISSELSKTKNQKESFVDQLIKSKTETPPLTDNQQTPLGDLIDFDEIVRILANGHRQNFGAAVGKLLLKARYARTLDLSQVLWVAQDKTAQPFLIEKLLELNKNLEGNIDPSHEQYRVIRALATCCTPKGANIVLRFIQDNPNLSIRLPDEVLRPLIRRKVIPIKRISDLAVDREGTHEFTRRFCLEALGRFNASKFTDVFLDAFKNDPYIEAQSFSIHALGFVKTARRKEVIRTLEDALQNTDKHYIATAIGEALVRLKSEGSLAFLEAAIKRFDGTRKMAKLTRYASQFRSDSTFALLPDDVLDFHSFEYEAHYLISAVGEYYLKNDTAKGIIRTCFESTYPYDSNKQSMVVNTLLKQDPEYLFQQAVLMYDADTLETSAIYKIIESGLYLIKSGELDQGHLVELYKRLICDRSLKIRETVNEILEYLNPDVRQKIYDELGNIQNEWVRGNRIYSMAFWDSDISEIEQAKLDGSKTVRFFANAASKIREKRADLEKLSNTFRDSESSAERVSAYLGLMEQANTSQIDKLYDLIEYEHPAFIFLESLEEKVKKRTEEDIKKRDKDEKEKFCRRIRSL
jgi:HEAT repeat protein